jgi:hypothetical protein
MGDNERGKRPRKEIPTKDIVYRLTIEDHDPSWVEDRTPDVHGMPAGTGHYWTDRDGRLVEGYEPGAVCGGCGWDPAHPEIRPS